MKKNRARRDAWETGSGEIKPGYFHALHVRWNRMGYPAWLFLLALCIVPVLMIMPGFLLVLYADKLGIWWAILLILYMAILFSVYTWIVYPREMARMRYLLGDEAFFLVYPEEKKKELKRQQRARLRAERRNRR